MAFFGVTIETIEKIDPIPNADLIQQCFLKNTSFSFVIRKDSFKVGETVIYFPVDSLLPIYVQQKLGVEGKLSGKFNNRIRIVKLKGIYSNGIIAPLSLLDKTELINFVNSVDRHDGFKDELARIANNWENDVVKIPSDLITDFFGVKKYEPEVVLCKNANLIPLKLGLSAYDIEGTARNLNILEMMMDIPCYIGEKLEGMNSAHSISRQGEVFISQRNFTIEQKDGEEHSFHKVARNQKIIDFVNRLHIEYPDKNITVYGEFLGPGVQGNIYKFTENKVLLFDIKMDGSFIDAALFFELIEKFYDKKYIVPTLAYNKTLREFLNGRSIQEASGGQSALFNTLREGIVIKPMVEQNIYSFGRMILKERSLVYLSKSEN